MPMKAMPNMKRSHNTCVNSLKLLGDYWTLRIVDALRDQELRYCELQRTLDNVNPVTLTTKLKKLEKSGIINRTEESVDKISVSYCLTQTGNDVLPVIDAVNLFSVVHTT